MADYIYLLENRLSAAQQAALTKIREIARTKGLTVFLVGGAVRDLTSGSPVRDLDVVVQGNALKLKKDLEKAGGHLSGENETLQSLYVQFPGGVRMEVGSTLSVVFPKPGKMAAKPANILEDLRRRDFTANAMALSLNQGSYGLLMDPLNGVADIENRELRLVSNYGFIEDPVRMIRAARLMARLSWTMEERTAARYETGKQEGYISAMPAAERNYELEELFHEEDPLRVLRRLEHEGWMKELFPALTSAKANVAELERLRGSQTQLELQGIHPETSAAHFPLMTAKLSPKEISSLKGLFPRRAFVEEIASLEKNAKEFAAQLTSKSAGTPAAAWKLIHSAKPEAVLWTAHTSKAAAVQNKLKAFYTEWPQAKLKLPYALMQEMRIVPGVDKYDELLEKLFFELMDNKLTTVEEMKAYLEPYSPPAPPPPVNLRKARASKKVARAAKKKEALETQDADETLIAEDVEALDGMEPELEGMEDEVEGEAAEEQEMPPAKKAPAKAVSEPKGKAGKVAQVKVPTKTEAKVPAKKAAVKASVKTAAKRVEPKKAAPSKKPAAVKKAHPKPAAKKAPVKVAAKKVVAQAPAKKAVAKPAAKKAPAKKVQAKAVPKKKR
jgi:tRNA nucleotidyltransferase/poly(A) polymerase